MFKHTISRTRRHVLSVRKWRLRSVFWLGAIIIGITAALFALASFQADKFIRYFYHSYPLLSLLIPPIGLVIIVWLTRNVFKGSEGSGIPQSIAALEMKHGMARSAVLSIKVAIGKIILTVGGLFSGASIGREGPTIHIGASIMYSLRHLAPFRGRKMTRGLILAGGAAGISAAFNTPLAGIIFVIEEMSRSFEDKTSGTLLYAVIISAITAIFILGDYTYFGTSDVSVNVQAAWLAILVCGVIGGVFGGSFSQILIQSTRVLAPFATRSPLYLALICGCFISLFAYLSSGATLGTGYEEAKLLLTEGAAANIEYPFLKYLATMASYLSGIPGGIFAPSLSIGAGMGGDIASWFPELPFAALVILGMVGYFTGVVQTPLTVLVIVMEMTDNTSMLLPCMITALIAKGMSRLVCPESIYQALAKAYTQKLKLDDESDSTKQTPNKI